MARNQIFLIGCIKNQITGSKLPSRGDVLRVLYFNMREVRLNLHDSASLVIDECLIFWQKARKPTHDRSHCIKKLRKLYEELRGLTKSKSRKSELCRERENDFKDNLNDLFDIAHSDAMKFIKVQEGKNILISQRKKGRVGSMLGIDRKLTAVEQRKNERAEKEMERKRKYSSISHSG